MFRKLKVDAEANRFRGWKAWLSPFFSAAMLTLLLYRASASLSKRGRGTFVLSRVFHRANMVLTGCHISPLSELGPGVRLPHPVGIVIGDGVRIGRNVTIYQNVTIGVYSPGALEYPSIGDDVTIFAGAVVAGRVNVSDGAQVGANSFVTCDIPTGGRAVASPAHVISPKS